MSKQEALLRQTIREMAKADAADLDSQQELILRETVRLMLLNEIAPDTSYAKPEDIFKGTAAPFEVAWSEIKQLGKRFKATAKVVGLFIRAMAPGGKLDDVFYHRVDTILDKASTEIEKIEKEYADAYKTVSVGLQDPLGFAFFTDPGLVITAALADTGGKGARSAWDAVAEFIEKKKKEKEDEYGLRGWLEYPKGGKPGRLNRPVGIFSADTSLIEKILKIANQQGLATSGTKNKLYIATRESEYQDLIKNLRELLRNLREADAPSDFPLFVGNVAYFNDVGAPYISYQEEQDSTRWTPRDNDISILENDFRKLPETLLKQALDGKRIIVFTSTPGYTGFPRIKPKDITDTTVSSPGPDNENDEKTDTKDKEQKTGEDKEQSSSAAGGENELKRISRQLASDDKEEAAAGLAAAIEYLKNSDELGKALGTTKAADAIQSIILKAVSEIVADAKKAVGIKDFKTAQFLVSTLGPDAQPLADLIKKSESSFNEITADPKKKADASKAINAFWEAWRGLVKQQYSAAINAAMQEQKIPAGSELAKIYAAAAQKIADL